MEIDTNIDTATFFLSDQEKNGKNVLLKALLNLKNGRNDTIEYLLDISEKMGDLNKFVNAAYTDSFYKGEVLVRNIIVENMLKHYALLCTVISSSSQFVCMFE